MVVVGVQKKVPGDRAEFSKRPPGHRRSQKPQSLNIWHQIFRKRGKQKKLFQTDITPERKEIIWASNKNRPSRASLKTFRTGWVPPTPATYHSPMTDVSVIRQLRWSFWWRIYPSYGTQRVKNHPIKTARASSSNFESLSNSNLFQSRWSDQHRRPRCSADLAARGALRRPLWWSLTLYRPISQLLENLKLAFALKEQYLNNYKRYHHNRHTVGKVFSLRIRWWKV